MKKIILGLVTALYMIFIMTIITVAIKNLYNAKMYILSIILSTMIYYMFLIIFLIFFKGKKIKASKGNFNKSNIDVRVNELYNILYEYYSQSLAIKRKKHIKDTIVASVFYIILFALLVFVGINMPEISPLYMIPILILCGICSVITAKFGKFKKAYKEEYKNEIISKFVKLISADLEYTIKDEGNYIGQKYDDSEFDINQYTDIHAQDYIIGKLLNDIYIEIAEIFVERETGSGRTREVTELFKGMFVLSQLNNTIPNTIKISTNSKRKKNNEDNKFELDDAEFEKYFDVSCENRILATRILTADVMNMMTDFYKNIGIVYEITIKEDNLYLRFYTEKMFEPKIYGKVLDKEEIYTYYNTLKFIAEVTEKINNVVSEIDV